MSTNQIVSKVWSFCNTLRDDGFGYGDYLEQLTYLLFLKMADEYSKPPYSRKMGIPAAYNWQSLKGLTGSSLEVHYVDTLRELGKEKGILGQIFTKSQNKIQDPAKLYKLIDLIDKENWVIMDADVKGDIYESLPGRMQRIRRAAPASTLRRVRSSGQWWNVCACNRCAPLQTRPAARAVFFLAAYDFIADKKNFDLDKEQKQFLKFNTLRQRDRGRHAKTCAYEPVFA